MPKLVWGLASLIRNSKVYRVIRIMKVEMYNLKGEKIGMVELPEKVFGVDWNADLVRQVVESMRANQRRNIAHTKGRGEVRGGGAKPWVQKGTGRARHGSIRSPIWKGGGVTHGPTKEKNYSKKINKKMKQKALFAVLSQKLRDKEVLMLDALELPEPKTKQAVLVLKNLAKIKGFEKLNSKRKNAALIALAEKIENIIRGFRNIPNIDLIEARNLNVLEVLSHKYLIIPKASIELLPGN